MKVSKTAISIALSLSLAVSSVPVLNCSAYSNYDNSEEYITVPKSDRSI